MKGRKEEGGTGRKVLRRDVCDFEADMICASIT